MAIDHPTSTDLSAALNLIHAGDKYQVLERLGDIEPVDPHDGVEPRVGLVLDLETTGLDSQADKIIEIGLLRFSFDPSSGQVLAVESTLSYFEDPGMPLSETITELTGITDAMVAGQSIDDAIIAKELEVAGIVIAHNAGFDRPFFEKRFESIQDKHWACSLSEVPWKSYGFRCKKLGCLLVCKNKVYFEGHRAGNDCLALLHLLAKPFEDGAMPLDMLLHSARQRSFPLRAVGAPFEVKDILKRHGYQWNDGSNGQPRAWWKEVFESLREEELDWLAEHGYSGERDRWTIGATRSARTRYK